MNAIISQVFLYLACVFLLNSLAIYIFRRLKLSDFIAHILTGVIFSAGLMIFSQYIHPDTAISFDVQYQLEQETLNSLSRAGADSSKIANLENFTRAGAVNETAFVDSLSAILGQEMVAEQYWAILNESRNESPVAIIIAFLGIIGATLFLIHLGFNFDPRFLTAGNNMSLFVQVVLISIISLVIVGSACYFFVFDQQLAPSLLLTGAFLSLSIGAVLTSRLPMKSDYKVPFSILVKSAAVLDVLSIIIFSIVVVFFQYQQNSWQRLDDDIFYWVALIVMTLLVLLSQFTNAFFELFQKWIGSYVSIIKIGMLFLFLYIGFHINLPFLMLGIWAGLLMKFLFSTPQQEQQKYFFAAAQFLYILPFVEIGRILFQAEIFNQASGYNISVIILALICTSLLIGLLNIRNKNFPLMMAIGA